MIGLKDCSWKQSNGCRPEWQRDSCTAMHYLWWHTSIWTQNPHLPFDSRHSTPINNHWFRRKNDPFSNCEPVPKCHHYCKCNWVPIQSYKCETLTTQSRLASILTFRAYSHPIDCDSQINNNNEWKWFSARSTAVFDRTAAFQCRVVNGGQSNFIFVGLMSHNADWNTIANYYPGYTANSIGYYGCMCLCHRVFVCIPIHICALIGNGYPYHNGSCQSNHNWGKYGSGDRIDCLMDYRSGDVSYFRNGTKVGTYRNAIPIQPYHFVVTLSKPNQSVIVRYAHQINPNPLVLCMRLWIEICAIDNAVKTKQMHYFDYNPCFSFLCCSIFAILFFL